MANPNPNPNPNANANANPTLHSRTLLLLGLPGGSGPGDVRPSSSHLAAEAGPLLVCQWGVDMTLVRACACTVPCTHSCTPLHTAPMHPALQRALHPTPHAHRPTPIPTPCPAHCAPLRRSVPPRG